MAASISVVRPRVSRAFTFRGFLESCGIGGMVNGAMSLMEKVPAILTPGGTDLPLDDVAMMVINSPDRVDEIRFVLSGFNVDFAMEKKFMHLHPLACKLMFGGLVEGEYVTGLRYDDLLDITLAEGKSVEVHLPGHFVAAVLTGNSDMSLWINDSWPERPAWGPSGPWTGGGFNRPLSLREFATAHDEFVVYRKVA
jgi:hypothetical protein